MDPDRPRAARTFVYSRPRDFRDGLDAGGLTKDERAFTRSVYYQTDKTGVKVWSARLDWGKIERRGSRWGRQVRVRLYVYGSRSLAAASKRGAWSIDEGSGSFAAGSRRSLPGARVDDSRRAG